jgi:hypothetical protein
MRDGQHRDTEDTETMEPEHLLRDRCVLCASVVRTGDTRG